MFECCKGKFILDKRFHSQGVSRNKLCQTWWGSQSAQKNSMTGKIFLPINKRFLSIPRPHSDTNHWKLFKLSQIAWWQIYATIPATTALLSTAVSLLLEFALSFSYSDEQSFLIWTELEMQRGGMQTWCQLLQDKTNSPWGKWCHNMKSTTWKVCITQQLLNLWIKKGT